MDCFFDTLFLEIMFLWGEASLLITNFSTFMLIPPWCVNLNEFESKFIRIWIILETSEVKIKFFNSFSHFTLNSIPFWAHCWLNIRLISSNKDFITKPLIDNSNFPLWILKKSKISSTELINILFWNTTNFKEF